MAGRRRRLARAAASALAVAAIAALAAGWLLRRADGPVGMLPGGAFRAASEPCPAAWHAIPDPEEIELELRPADPRSVTTWSVRLDAALFVPADFLTPIKRWPHQVTEDPRVRLRIDGRVFACRLRRITGASTVERLRNAAAAKYALDPDGWAARAEVWWFRAEPRASSGSQPSVGDALRSPARAR